MHFLSVENRLSFGKEGREAEKGRPHAKRKKELDKRHPKVKAVCCAADLTRRGCV